MTSQIRTKQSSFDFCYQSAIRLVAFHLVTQVDASIVLSLFLIECQER